jgi:site-specific DNA-methyltransferase (adenine-specific)
MGGFGIVEVPHDPRSSGRESAPFELGRDQSRLTSAATVQGFNARNYFFRGNLSQKRRTPPDLILPFARPAQIIPRVPRKTKETPHVEPPPAPGSPLAGLSLTEDSPGAPRAIEPFFADDARGLWLFQGNSLAVLDAIAERHPHGLFDMIFADPPYFLSNGGITCHAGKMVKVDKGEWDKSRGPELNHEFNTEWLKRCQRVLKPNGTLWVTGTLHVIFSVGYAMQQLGFKILNDIAWEKPNPPPNLSCRYFTHSTETLLWAAKNEKSRHVFNYADMRRANGGKQMKTVWRMYSPTGIEKRFGKHPTQKPLALVERCLLASTAEGALVLDPFLGNGTTAVACRAAHRRCVGIELEEKFLRQALLRLDEADRNLFDGKRG